MQRILPLITYQPEIFEIQDVKVSIMVILGKFEDDQHQTLS